MADPAPPYIPTSMRDGRIACVRDIARTVLPGSHHLHMTLPARSRRHCTCRQASTWPVAGPAGFPQARDNPAMSQPPAPDSAMTHPDLPLGREVVYPDRYDAGLLFPIPRALGRGEIGLRDDALPFAGHDRWHAYELSWLTRARWSSRPRRSPCRRTRRTSSNPSRSSSTSTR